jgi:hypothetical protein
MTTTTETKPTWGKAALGSFSEPERMSFIHQVYGWMCGGLILTGWIAYMVSINPAAVHVLIDNRLVFMGLVLLEFVMVASLASLVHKISAGASAALFILYAAFNGLTLSVIFLLYRIESISQVFFITAGLFGLMSLFGYLTKRDLTSTGSFALMGLIGLVIAGLANLFFQSSMATLVMSAIGVVVFVLLTAYDTQKLKWLYELGRTEGADGEEKEAINGALTLYLDFINLFLDLIKLMGRRR